MSSRNIWLLWGTMDALYLIWYFTNSVLNRRVPYLTDVVSALDILQSQGALQFYMFILFVVLQVSIFASCVMFFLNRRSVRRIVFLQAPLRLVFVLPSVSLLLVGARIFPQYSVALMVLLIGASEILKIWSVGKWSKNA